MTTHIEYSERLKSLPPYLFAEIDRARREALAAGRDVINLGVGDPDQRTLRRSLTRLKKPPRTLTIIIILLTKGSRNCVWKSPCGLKTVSGTS